MNNGRLTAEEIRKLNAKLPLGPGVLKLNAPIDERPSDPAMKVMEENRRLQIRPTTDEDQLNKTEKSYLIWLRQQQNTWIGIQCITLKLGHDCRYTPDFWAFDETGLRAIDTKGGHVWEDSLIKIRIAARLFPWIHFVIAKRDGQLWKHTSFKP